VFEKTIKNQTGTLVAPIDYVTSTIRKTKRKPE